MIPANVEFVCVVGTIGHAGDGLVRADCQWTPDLQRQGVPAVVLRTGHLGAMRSKAIAKVLADLVAEPQPRWTAGQVDWRTLKVLGQGIDKTSPSPEHERR